MMLVVVGGGSASALKDEAPLPAPWKIQFKVILDEHDGEYIFSVKGTTNLPAETHLRARIYAVEVIDDPRRGKREDEEPLVWGDDVAQPEYRPVIIMHGKFRQDVHRFYIR